MTQTVGFVGLGRMGRPMVAVLRAAGHTVLAHDVSEQARAATPGSVEHLADAVADVLVLMLPSSTVVETVLADPAVVGALRPGALVVDMSSSDPRSTRVIGAQLAQRGIGYVDAPVSGGVPRAEQGTLSIMAGGTTGDVERARPLLAVLGEVTHVGSLGAGHAVKACNNVLAGVSLLAAVEVLEVLRGFGVDPAVAFGVINTSTGRSWSTEHKLPTYVLPAEYRSGFALGLLVKDMGIAADLAADLGVEHSLMVSALRSWREAGEALPDDADHTSVAEWVAGRRRPTGTPAASR